MTRMDRPMFVFSGVLPPRAYADRLRAHVRFAHIEREEQRYVAAASESRLSRARQARRRLAR